MNLKDFEHVDQCKTCMYSKIHAQSFSQETSKRIEDLLEVIHSDVCGPFRRIYWRLFKKNFCIFS